MMGRRQEKHVDRKGVGGPETLHDALVYGVGEVRETLHPLDKAVVSGAITVAVVVAGRLHLQLLEIAAVLASGSLFGQAWRKR